MTPKDLKSQIIYGFISGIIYAGFIAIVDYYRDKEFDLKKFILGFVFFGLAMFIVTKVKSKKEK